MLVRPRSAPLDLQRSCLPIENFVQSSPSSPGKSNRVAHVENCESSAERMTSSRPGRPDHGTLMGYTPHGQLIRRPRMGRTLLYVIEYCAHGSGGAVAAACLGLIPTWLIPPKGDVCDCWWSVCTLRFSRFSHTQSNAGLDPAARIRMVITRERSHGHDGRGTAPNQR